VLNIEEPGYRAVNRFHNSKWETTPVRTFSLETSVSSGIRMRNRDTYKRGIKKLSNSMGQLRLYTCTHLCRVTLAQILHTRISPLRALPACKSHTTIREHDTTNQSILPQIPSTTSWPATLPIRNALPHAIPMPSRSSPKARHLKFCGSAAQIAVSQKRLCVTANRERYLSIAISRTQCMRMI
jgi:hypothetical protein